MSSASCEMANSRLVSAFRRLTWLIQAMFFFYILVAFLKNVFIFHAVNKADKEADG